MSLKQGRTIFKGGEKMKKYKLKTPYKIILLVLNTIVFIHNITLINWWFSINTLILFTNAFIYSLLIEKKYL